jgi:DNA-binding MarR family transcriptional regulator
MANERDLVAVMKARKRLWSPSDLCDELNVQIGDLVKLIKKARKAGALVKVENGEHTHFTSKLWLMEG